MITRLIGDALNPYGYGPKIIAHVVNDRGGWGRGFSGELGKRWPQAEEDYRNSFRQAIPQLGLVRYIMVDGGEVLVANLYAQHGYSSPGNPAIRYPALDKCFGDIAVNISSSHRIVHMPLIGCGLGGGTEEELFKILEKHFRGEWCSVFVYDQKEAAT